MQVFEGDTIWKGMKKALRVIHFYVFDFSKQA